LGVHLHAKELNIDSAVPSYILIEAQSGKVLCEKDADLELAPASVTKVMTMLLIMEAIDNGIIDYEDTVVTSANAASMGGSQVYLKEGEEFSVNDMLKSISMASANDACVAMAEHLSGSEEAFVEQMNQKAEELGMEHTSFENTNGLDDTVTNHYTTARDIAIMSAELIVKHPDILKYTSVWMDTLRNGAFGLTNTNRLIRFYKGANGLKTGSTSKAGFCISVSAYRDGMQLICVIMKAPSRDIRNESAKKLLDYGFANYSSVSFENEILRNQKILCSSKDNYEFTVEGYNGICAKGFSDKVEKEVKLNKKISAPLKKGDKVGTVTYTLDDEILYKGDVTVNSNVDKITYFGLLWKIIKNVF
ncbi:MAG: D-alanyl-D-alanine carboxypeptidase, partial [Clostridia bacterium]|nr:D-alanyl-D-alanine carboxypeptidase [Clostridia bacterium]